MRIAAKLRWVAAYVQGKLVNAVDSIIGGWFKAALLLGIGWFAGVISALLFGGGASIENFSAQLPPGYDRYAFVGPVLADAEREMAGVAELHYEPPGLARLRFCGSLDFEDPPSGLEFFNQILGRLGDCVEQDRSASNDRLQITLKPNPSSKRYAETVRSRGPGNPAEPLYFCGCSKETVKLVETNTIFR